MQEFAMPKEEGQAAADLPEVLQSQGMVPIAQPDLETEASNRSGQVV